MLNANNSPIVVGFMNPVPFDTSILWDTVRRHSAVSLHVEEIGYEEEWELHVAKTNGQDAALVGHHEPTLSPAQLAALDKVEVILALDLPFQIRNHAPNLKWVQGYGAGVTQLVSVLKGSDVWLTSAAGVGAPGIAEFVMGRLLQVWKRLRLLDEQQGQHVWEQQFGERLAGRTLGIVGLGAIGVEVARRAAAFDMVVIATKRDPSTGVPGFVSRAFAPDGLPELLAESDAVIVSASLNPDTRSLIGAAQLAMMRRGALLCNVGRGALLDEVAVVDALRTGHLGAAILDTTRTEPLPHGDPLWEAPNMFLSPHTSNCMDGYADRLGALFAENLNRYVDGLPLKNLVDTREVIQPT
jgi:phosphoglycerate dehydrogenase-like enzyme